MYSSRPSHAVKDSRPLSFFFGTKSKQQRQTARKRSSAAAAADRDKQPASRTFLSPTSSSRFLLSDVPYSSSSSSFPDLVPDFELDPVPELIQIDHSRFHFEAGGGGSFDLRSSASFCRPKENSVTSSSGTCARTGATWARFDSSDRRPGMIKQREIGCSGASTSSWSDEDGGCRDVLIKTNKVGSKESGDHQAHHVAVQQDETAGTSAVLNPSSSSCSSRSIDQVVDLRVSLHCKGCERKLRKHLSRMQGVTSFSIEFAAKKVTVVGDVTALDVVSSISKVKNTQIWS